MDFIAKINQTRVKMECLDVQNIERLEGAYLIVIRAIVDTFIVLFIVSANAIIIIAIVRSRHRKRKTEQTAMSSVSVRFALNLSVADFLVGVSTAYYLSSKYLCSVVNILSQLKYLCLLMFIMIICAHAVSAYTIMVIAIDRYIAVVHALRYRELMNTKLSRIIICLVWLVSLCISLPILFWNQFNSAEICEETLVVPLKYLPIITAVSHTIIMGIVGGFHGRIHREASASDQRKRSREYGDQEDPDGGTGHTFNRKSARVFLLVTGCYVICWMPITIILFFRGYAAVTPIIDVLYNYFFTFLNLNYLINPIVYSWMNPTVRGAIKELIQVFKCNSKVTSENCDQDNGEQNTFSSHSTVYSAA